MPKLVIQTTPQDRVMFWNKRIEILNKLPVTQKDHFAKDILIAKNKYESAHQSAQRNQCRIVSSKSGEIAG